MKDLEEIYNKINNLTYLLDRKIELLSLILNITKNQKLVFENNKKQDTLPFLDISIEEKQKLIDELVSIDDMFLSIFESFKGNLNKHKDIFKEDIKTLKHKIQEITELDFKIRIQEEKNKNLQNINIKNNLMNVEKVKTLKVSKDNMLKKYKNNTNK